MPDPSISVIIPTTGSNTLIQCVKSVLDQTYDNVKPYVVFDGPPKKNPLWDLEEDSPDYIDYCVLPYNVGSDGWYGHRIFAAFSYLVESDYVCFLDQDNWFEPNHIETLIETIYNHPGWAYSLRNIVDIDGNFVCRDDCESLGQYGHHIDTSCFMVPTSSLTAQGLAVSWYGKWGADRQFYQMLQHVVGQGCCSGRYTVNYRLGGNPGSVSKEFFLQGNKQMKLHYPIKFPWNKED